MRKVKTQTQTETAAPAQPQSDLLESKDSIIARWHAPTPPPRDDTIGQIIRAALAQDDIDLDRLERFYALKRQYDADEAEKAYVADMAKLKATEDLTVLKDKHVKFKNSQGGHTEYDHASIGNVCEVAASALGRHGFSHSWETVQEGLPCTLVKTTCVITHRLGHSKRLTLQGPPDRSGGKNEIQAIISAKSYFERHTLTGAMGIATRDQEDDDGRGGAGFGKKPEEERVETPAEKLNREWVEVMDCAADIEGLEARRVEMKSAYGDVQPPAAVLSAYWLKLFALAQDSLVLANTREVLKKDFAGMVPKYVRDAFQQREAELAK